MSVATSTHESSCVFNPSLSNGRHFGGFVPIVETRCSFSILRGFAQGVIHAACSFM
jgi:hypothetical protein